MDSHDVEGGSTYHEQANLRSSLPVYNDVIMISVYFQAVPLLILMPPLSWNFWQKSCSVFFSLRCLLLPSRCSSDRTGFGQAQEYRYHILFLPPSCLILDNTFGHFLKMEVEPLMNSLTSIFWEGKKLILQASSPSLTISRCSKGLWYPTQEVLSFEHIHSFLTTSFAVTEVCPS